MNRDHCEVVSQSLSGQKPVDENTYASLAVLRDRLDRVRKLGGKFADIGFSPEAKQLARNQQVASLC